MRSVQIPKLNIKSSRTGPFIAAVAFQLYLFISTHSLVRVQTIITQLVFEHALRMRMKAETNGSEQGDEAEGGNSSSQSNGSGKLDSSNLTGKINNLVRSGSSNPLALVLTRSCRLQQIRRT